MNEVAWLGMVKRALAARRSAALPRAVVAALSAVAVAGWVGCHEGDPFVFDATGGGGGGGSTSVTGTGGNGGGATTTTASAGGAGGLGGSGGGGASTTASGTGGAATTTTGAGGATSTSASTTTGAGGQGGGSSSTGGGGASSSGAGGEGAGGGVVGEPLWSLGSGSADSFYMRASVATDPAGNVVLSGNFAGSLDLGAGAFFSAAPGMADVFLARFSPGGAPLWSKRWGDILDQWAGPLAVDAQRILVGSRVKGSINFGGSALTSLEGQDLCIAELAPSGDHVWSECFGGPGDQTTTALALAADGGAYLAGTNAGAIVNMGDGTLTSSGGADIVLARLDAGGAPLWKRQYGGEMEQILRSLALPPSGDVVATGSIQGSVSFGGDTFTSAGGDDLVVVEVDPAGNHVWSARYGDAMSQHGNGIATDAAGDTFVAGDFRGTLDLGGGHVLTSAGLGDAFVFELDAAHHVVWARAFGGASDDAATSIALAPSGELLVTGAFGGSVDFGGETLTSAGDTDVFVARFTAGGQLVSARSFGAPLSQQGSSIAVDPADHPLVAGVFAGSIDFGQGPFTTAKVGVFVAKLAP